MTDEKECQGRILVVDDEKPVAQLLQKWLEGEGYAVRCADGFDEARVRLEEEGFDLVTLDIMMPEVDGLQVLRWIGEHHPDTGVIMATAMDQTDPVLEAMRAGAINYLLKPFNLELVTEEVKRGMERQRLIAENRAYQRELERKVEERTRALWQKVRELDGRDRLVHFQMEAHSLEEAYSEVLEVVAQVFGVGCVVLYRRGEEGELEEVMGLGLAGPGRLERGGGREREKELATRALATQKLQRGEGGSVAVPILYREESLGALEVEFTADGVDEESLNGLWRLGGEIALVLQGAAMAEDLEQRDLLLDELADLA